MTYTNRRVFIKTAAIGAVTAGLSSRRIYSEENPKMVFRKLGSTGYNATEIGFGAMNTRDPELIQAAIDSGINYLDTAHVYMNGVNEEIIGKIMKKDRKKVFLTTKVGPWENNIPACIDLSLKRLQTDHVDLLLLHAIEKREDVFNENIMKYFEDARKSGKTRFIGVSTHSGQSVVLDAVVEGKFWEAVLVGYNYFSDKSVKDSINKAHDAGIAIIGMKNILNPQSFPWKPLDDIRKDKNAKMTPQQTLVKWVLEDPNIDTTIPGITSFEQLKDDIALMNMKMSSGDRNNLRRYAENFRYHYCCGVAGCDGCKDKCPSGVDVRTINRCLGYANGYGDIELARQNYSYLADVPLGKCAECDECSVRCINNINISDNIKRAKELFL